MNARHVAACLIALTALSGCSLREIRSKTRGGPEFTHKGETRASPVRYLVEQGIEFKWDNDVTTGLVYRRGDEDDGSGDSLDRLFFEFTFPLWKAPDKSERLARRVEALERRLAELDAQPQAMAR